MLCPHLIAYWIIGLPLGYWLCFGLGWGALGLWAGLSLALILIGVVLLLATFWAPYDPARLSQATPRAYRSYVSTG